MMRYTMAVAVVLGCGLAQSFGQGGGARAKEIDIEGTYTCVGEIGNGKNYRGTTTITKKDDVYVISWTIAKETHEGTAIRTGDTLSVVWRNSSGDTGVVVYQIRARGKLEGKWTFLGSTRKYDENLTMDN